MVSNEMKEKLLQMAIETREKAYVPYSKYKVGAALLTKSGKIFTGVNIENAAYPNTMCAERVAVFKAVSEGEKEFEAIAVVTENAGVCCGGCRQVLAEFGLDTIIIIADDKGKVRCEPTVGDLLPGAFTPDQLPRK
jgi:cytidine deaminase